MAMTAQESFNSEIGGTFTLCKPNFVPSACSKNSQALKYRRSWNEQRLDPEGRICLKI